MGAGTTEFSVNRVGEPGADQRVPCYQDESVPLGGDTFDWIDSESETVTQHSERTERLVEFFLKVFRRTWGKGYAKDARIPAARDRWRRFHVLLAGGAARRPVVEEAIRNALPITPWPIGESRYDVHWHEPSDIDMTGRENGKCGSKSFLAVANGLTVHRREWPLVLPPREIRPQEASVLPEKLPAYWYLD